MIRLEKSSRRNLLLGFGFSLLILIFSSVVSYLSIVQLLESQRLVAHTTEVESTLSNLISKLKDAETGQRGYLLSNEQSFLDPYRASKSEIYDDLAKTQLLTIDNGAQQKDIPTLEKLIERKISYIDRSITNKERGIPPTMNALVAGKKTMDSIRTLVKVMINRENVLMQSRTERLTTFSSAAPITIAIAAAIAMIITVLFYYRVNKDAKVALKLQNELKAKEHKTAEQVKVIEDVAKKIASGRYETRVNQDDLN